MSLNVTLADYGVGNLHSISKALENCGAKVTVVEDMSLLLDAQYIVLPGVGAFSRTMERLLPYSEEIRDMLLSGTPCLGICIGAHILYQGSDEGTAPGLGFIEGRVAKLHTHQVPEMGWNSIEGDDPIFEGIANRYFYFAHTYIGRPEENVMVGTTHYHETFASLVRKANTYGSQFHPEKSSDSGLRFISNFVRFAEGCQ